MKLICAFLAFAYSALSLGQEFNPYQIGSQWGRKAFTAEDIDKIKPHLLQTAKSTAKFLGGTAFYLGYFDGKHIMATNYHVLPTALNCYSLSRADFVLEEFSLPCHKFLMSLPQIELSLFQVKPNQAQAKKLKDLGVRFDPDSSSRRLYGLGFGGHLNPSPGRRALLISDDEHCKEFSSEIRLIKDPDNQNPVDYRVWSVAVGCDVSHGDSGAPVVNERGELVGIFWTGAFPKSSLMRNDNFLMGIESNHPMIWKAFTYMVPFSKIREVFNTFLRQNPDHSMRGALKQFLN